MLTKLTHVEPRPDGDILVEGCSCGDFAPRRLTRPQHAVAVKYVMEMVQGRL